MSSEAQHPDDATWRLPGGLFFVLAAVVYIGLTLVRIWPFAGDGRFWAEGGRDFFPGIEGGAGLLYLFKAHLEITANVVIWLATLVPFRIAPLVTTYGAVILQALPLALLAARHRDLGISQTGVLAFIALQVMMLPAAEVWANPINLHFHMAIASTLILCLPVPETPRGTWAMRAGLLGLGLTGIPANFLWPLFGLRALVSRERERWVQTAILLATTAFQAVLLVTGPAQEKRAMEIVPVDWLLASFTHLIVMPLVPFMAALTHVGEFQRIAAGEPAAVFVTLVCFLLLAALIVRVALMRDAISGWLLATALLVLVPSLLAAIGDPRAMINPFGGGRYFFVPLCLIMLVLVRMASQSRLKLEWLLLAWIGWVGLDHFEYGFYGPDWSETYAATPASAPTIAIWPDGWEMPNYKPADAR